MGGIVSLVTAEMVGRVGVIELNRPERHNSLVPELLTSLIEAHQEIVDGGALVGRADRRRNHLLDRRRHRAASGRRRIGRHTPENWSVS